jgi:hypothetical protein
MTITRYDLGSILGTILSWVSLLAFIFGLLISKVMEMSLLLSQA